MLSKFAFVVIVFLSFFGFANPIKIEIVSDYNPSFGEAPGDLATQLLLIITRNLKNDMKIDFVPASREREWRELQNQENVCLYNKVKTPQREAMGVFVSFPLMAFPSNRLILRNKKFVSIEVSLKDALSMGLRIGVTQGRSYGLEIDDFIKANTDRMFISEGNDSAFRLRQMLVQGRLDGIIEYSSVFVTDFPSEEVLKDISFHAIGDTTATIFGYIACSDSRTGRAAVDLFERTLQKRTIQELIIQAHANLFLPQEEVFISNSLKSAFNIKN
ncbi:ABC transporter substrate-binding protein [Pseudoalteromonas luteoviolacea]|uniref:ABC transporter substrate-binding protein n=1 Tax=Pseudoalteromonas luteoviolacea TaxID=43657 RepID=UPI001B3975E0|nr:ABC transporter substrate-binding protein [Pseudoalteromonas luteoviolacea]MBQ4836498.1 ABC transporter substrate-binding protein [Pseudoalteromonas luteoviolacea]